MFVSLTSHQCASVRHSLESLSWPRSMRYNVPGDGFCIGASQNRTGPKYSEPIGNGQRACVAAVNALIHSMGFSDFCWSSLQFNKNTDAQPHVDHNNMGLSFVLILGDYSGGALVVPSRGLATQPRGSPIGVFIDGREYHHTTPRSGKGD